METKTSEAGMEARGYSQSGAENPESKPLMEISKGSESDDLTDSASEAEMEIQIGAVFSLASDYTSKQNETMESEPNESATTSFTESTVSAVEDDTLNKLDEKDVTHEENYIENSMNAENSTMDINNVCVESPHPLSSFVKVDMDASGRTCLSKTTKDSVSRHSKPYPNKTTEHTTINYDNKNIINGRKVSYCYVKLFDILHHRVVRQEVMNVDKKPEIDNEATFQELDQSQKTQPKKKMKRKPPRLTRKKKIKKNASTDGKEVPQLQGEDPSIQEKEIPQETAAPNVTPLPDSTADTLPLRPSRKRKFNRKLITDAVFFDSRGISNFEDHVIQKQEEEEIKCRTAPTYGFRGSRPQVARTKKKLNRIQREDMPFISVILDCEKIEKIEKTNLASSKEKVNRPISCLLDRKVILYSTLFRTSSGSFRILKDRSKSSILKTIAKAMKKETLKSKSKQSGKSNSEQTESGIKKSKAVSVLKKLIMKKNHQAVIGPTAEATPRYRQMMSGLNAETTPAYQQRVTEPTAEAIPPYRQMVSGLNAEATPACQQRVTEPTAEAAPAYQQSVTEPTAEAFPPYRQMMSVPNAEATPTHRQLVSSPTAEADPPYQRMVTHAEDKVDMKAALPSTKHLATNSDSSVLPVKVEPGTSSSVWNNGTSISVNDRVSVTGGYRKNSDKCSSFTTNFERNWNVPPKLSGKTEFNSEPHPYIEMDTAADAEAVVQKQQGEIYYRSSHVDHMYSSDMRKKRQKQEANMTKSPKPQKTFVKGLAQSSQNKGGVVPKVVPNVTTEQPTIKTNSGNLKSFKPKMMLAIQPPSKNLSEQSNLFKSTVNKLAKIQNTKKFYQLRIGDKMVLIPAEGGDVVQKAYVIDVASNPLFTRTCTGNSTTVQIPGLCTAKSSDSSTNLIDSKSAVGDIDFKRESKEYEFEPTHTSNTDSVLSTKLSNAPSTGNVKQPLISPPVLSPQLEISGSLYSYSKHTSPVLIPKTDSLESGECNDTERPVLHQEVVSCEGDASNLNQMRSVPLMLHKDDSPVEVSTSISGLPTSCDRPPPQLTLVSDGTVVVKQDPAHLRNFEGGKSTKESLSNITTQGSGSVDNQKISSLDSKPPLETGFVSADSENDMGNPSNKTDLTPPVVDCNQPNPLSSSATKDNDDKNSSLHPSVASVVDDQDTPRSNEEIKDRDRDKFGIETVTHVPADETMVQQRIRQLRERLRETQANLDNIRKTNRIKKENMEDGYDT